MTDIGHLEQRIADLEARVEQQADRIDSLENEVEAERHSRQEAQARIQDLETTVEHQDVLLDALRKRLTTTRGMIGELQSRELEKGAHLQGTPAGAPY